MNQAQRLAKKAGFQTKLVILIEVKKKANRKSTTLEMFITRNSLSSDEVSSNVESSKMIISTVINWESELYFLDKILKMIEFEYSFYQLV